MRVQVWMMVAAGAAMMAGEATAQARPVARAAAATKVGYVDFRGVIQQVPGFEEAQAQFQRESAKTDTLLKVLEDSVTSTRADLTARLATMPPTQAEAKRTEQNTRELAWAAKADTLQGKLRLLERNLFAPLREKALIAVEAVRKEGGFMMVFDVSSEASTIVAADTTLDVSAKAVAKLRAAPRN
jgi:Skp family chaperone for outer membrane proteins